MEGGNSIVKEFFGLTLTLGKRASGAVDVCAGSGMAAIEKECTSPDVDRLLVPRRKVMIQADEEELLDFAVAISRCVLVANLAALDLRHENAEDYNPEAANCTA